MKEPLSHQTILDSLEQSIFVKDSDSIYRYVNASYAALLQRTPSDIIGKSDYDLFPDTIAQQYRDDDSDVFIHGHVSDSEKQMLITNSLHTIRTVKRPLYSQGKVVAVLGIFWDITKEKQEENYYKQLRRGLNEAQALANIGHWELDLTNNKLFWSDEVYRIFGLKPQEFGATYDAFLSHVHPDDAEFVNRSYTNSVREGHGYHITHRIVRKDGTVGFVEERCEHDFDSNGEVIRSIGTIHDITEYKQTQNELLLASEVFAKMSDGVLITDAQQRVLKVNEAFSRITGYTQEELIGKNPSFLSSGWHDALFYKTMWQQIIEEGQWHGEILDRKKNGELYTAELTIIALKNSEGVLTNYIAISNDVSERKAQEKLIHNLAYFDSLTELPNRVLFEERFISRIPAARRSNTKMAMLFIDMDNFKNVNDTLGHFIGDKFLTKIAKRIHHALREEDTLARLGGDEFTVLIENIDSIMSIVPIAKKILDAFEEPVMLEQRELYSTASIGISIYPDDGITYAELIKAADTAMYHVKESGKNGYQFYTHAMNERLTERMLIENDLRHAIHNEELFLEYQPKVNLETQHVYGMEALVRWHHQQIGPIRPDIFIPIAEESGQIYPLGLWVAQQAFTDTKRLHDAGHMLRVSINVSSKQLEHDNFITDLCSIANSAGLDKSFIELEITESHIMTNIDEARHILTQLYENGFKLSIDDFGTGYSSLSYLKKLPVQTIKIDRSFVLDIDKDEDDRSITAAIIALAKSLGKEVIAEGSETQAHIDTLKFLHCNNVQGYFFSKPIPFESFKTFVENF